MSYVSNADYFERLAREFLEMRSSPSDSDEELVIIDTKGRPLLALVGEEGFLDSVRVSNEPTQWRNGRTAVVVQKPSETAAAS